MPREKGKTKMAKRSTTKRQPPYDPTPWEIIEATARIRRNWTADQYRQRAGITRPDIVELAPLSAELPDAFYW